MSRPQRYVVQPQRKLQGRGFGACPEHQAQRWAVLHLPSQRAIGAWGTKAEAQAVSDSMNARLRRRGKPVAASSDSSSHVGGRYGPLGVRGSGKIIASEGDYS